MTWRELQEEMKAFSEKELDKEIQFYFNGGDDKETALLLSAEGNVASLRYVNGTSEQQVKDELEVCTPYIYVDEG